MPSFAACSSKKCACRVKALPTRLKNFYTPIDILPLWSKYGIQINKDWGRSWVGYSKGFWAIGDLRVVLTAVAHMATALGGEDAFRRINGSTPIYVTRVKNGAGAASRSGSITLGDDVFNQQNLTQAADKELGASIAVVHELAHIWDRGRTNLLQKFNPFIYGEISEGLKSYVANEKGPTAYALTNNVEDWAESVAAYIYPDYLNLLNDPSRNSKYEKEIRDHGGPADLQQKHREFVSLQISYLSR